MTPTPEIEPLSPRHRSVFFYALLTIFVLALPFLFLYATGYRFSFDETGGIVSTGGIYVAAERTGAEIYIDNELVRETRVFRRAFYAQSLALGTHRVHVQKDYHHTWVKELPVYPHIVTEAQAFNLPLQPQVRVITPWQTATGTSVLFEPLSFAASTTEPVYVASTTATTTLVADIEYERLLEFFATTTATTTPGLIERVSQTLPRLTDASVPGTTSTSSLAAADLATTSKEWRGVKLYESESDVYAEFVGPREDMPYYYCAEEFPLLGTSTVPLLDEPVIEPVVTQAANTAELLDPVQTIPEDAECDPTIRIDRQWQSVTSFDFFPGSTDFVLMERADGIYVTEVDNRAWQNTQPLFVGEALRFHIESGTIYVFDGTVIYQIVLET